MHVDFDPLAMLQTLEAHCVEFVVIGGFAAWIQGAPVVTADLGIVFEATPENGQRLVAALTELDARYRQQFGRVIRPTARGLTSTQGAGHHLFETRAGYLDVLRTAAGRDYRDLVGEAEVYALEGATCLIVSLASIIELKQAAGRRTRQGGSHA